MISLPNVLLFVNNPYYTIVVDENHMNLVYVKSFTKTYFLILVNKINQYFYHKIVTVNLEHLIMIELL